jgi:hypothetical protein
MACIVFQDVCGEQRIYLTKMWAWEFWAGGIGGNTVSKKIFKKREHRDRYFKVFVGVNKNSYYFSLHEVERNLWFKEQRRVTSRILVFYRTFGELSNHGETKRGGRKGDQKTLNHRTLRVGFSGAWGRAFWYINSNASVLTDASIFYPEKRGSRFFRNVGAYSILNRKNPMDLVV